MPASNTRALSKAAELGSDAIIMDLEDSVAPDAKAGARNNVLDALRNIDYGHRITVLRVNHPSTEWFKADMDLLLQVKPHAVLLPKVESSETIADVQRVLDSLDSTGSIGLWAMLETLKAVTDAQSITHSKKQHARFQTICIGNNDIAREAGMQVSSDRSLLIPWLMSLLAAAKANGLTILDGVYNDFRDQPGFEMECEQGSAMGMDGKTLIHPSQIDIANKAFSPTRAEIENARAIVAEFAKKENAQVGVVQINGKMVERLHLEMAQQTLSMAERVRDSSSGEQLA